MLQGSCYSEAFANMLNEDYDDDPGIPLDDGALPDRGIPLGDEIHDDANPRENEVDGEVDEQDIDGRTVVDGPAVLGDVKLPTRGRKSSLHCGSQFCR